MDTSRLRLFASLAVAIWLAMAPRLIFANDGNQALEQVSGGDRETENSLAETACLHILGDQVQPFHKTATPTEEMHPELLAEMIAGQAGTQGNPVMPQTAPASLTGQVRESSESTDAVPTNRDFSPRDEALLMYVAAAQSKVTLARRMLRPGPPGAAARRADPKAAPKGTLCSRYESNGDSAAIGHDSKGGTLYGLYQIASRGTLNQFLDYLACKAPDIHQRLAASTPGDSRGTSGSMPDAWKRIAKEQSDRFAALQHDFIWASHYEPAARSIRTACGLDVTEKPPALREVLWSTSVQHGVQGAAEIFVIAADNLRALGASSQGFDRAMIEEVYRLRTAQFNRSGCVATSVRERLQSEKEKAVSML